MMADQNDIPDALNNALKRLHHAEPPPIGDRADDLVRLAARRRAPHQAHPLLLRRPMIGLAAAAGLAFAVGTLAILVQSSQPRGNTLVHDLNADGRTDILDALRLAHAVEAGTATLDLNRNGRSDAADVDALAMRAVTLSANTGGTG